ncbi:SemiSWEET transporter [Roseomonas sp. JC162]|uniref:SemiSWEET transporter n=1 Tax=Neoroseomonas marina TaxID=1232220 RepID=A0A848EFV2_9PROT|nr:SemiSWEET transporter [Neoroseomonas marina]NMJ42303.1 SemiSWEET transporter [Neoroseomonas marina]
MNPIEVLGLAAGALTTTAYLPQAVRTLRSGSARDLSLAMLLLLITGIVLWLAYGALAGLPAVVAANAATLLLTLPILWVKLRRG